MFCFLDSIISTVGEIEKDVEHRIKVGWLKWRLAYRVHCDGRMPVRLKGKFYIGQQYNNYYLWNRMLANQEATYAQNGCSIDENADVCGVKLGRIKLEISTFESI